MPPQTPIKIWAQNWPQLCFKASHICFDTVVGQTRRRHLQGTVASIVDPEIASFNVPGLPYGILYDKPGEQ